MTLLEQKSKWWLFPYHHMGTPFIQSEACSTEVIFIHNLICKVIDVVYLFFLADIMFDEEASDFQCFLNSFLLDEYDYSVINFEAIKSDKLNPQFLLE